MIVGNDSWKKGLIIFALVVIGVLNQIATAIPSASMWWIGSIVMVGLVGGAFYLYKNWSNDD